MAITANKRFWTEFIEIYHNLPSLWNTKDENYNNRETRSLAWNKLVEKLKEVEPNANQDSVKRKINTFRSNFNRELRKIRHTEKELPAEIYNPTLWYFNHLSFLLNQEKYSNNGVSTDGQYEEDITLMGLATAKNEIIENETRQAGILSQENLTDIGDNEKNPHEEKEELNCNNHDTPTETERKPSLDYNAEFDAFQKELHPAYNVFQAAENQKTLLDIEKTEDAQNVSADKSMRLKRTKLRLRPQGPYSKHFKNNSQTSIFTDEAAIYGQAWACGFRKLSPQQKLYAKKAIDEILILGQLNALKLQTVPANIKVLEETSDQG